MDYCMDSHTQIDLRGSGDSHNVISPVNLVLLVSLLSFSSLTMYRSIGDSILLHGFSPASHFRPNPRSCKFFMPSYFCTQRKAERRSISPSALVAKLPANPIRNPGYLRHII